MLPAGIDIGPPASMMKTYAQGRKEVCSVNPDFFIRAVAVWLTIMAASAPVPAAGQTAWRQAMNRDGIEVWTRSAPGSDFEDFVGMT